MSPPAERFPRGPVSPPYELERTPLSPPRMRGRSLHVDPSNRPQVILTSLGQAMIAALVFIKNYPFCNLSLQETQQLFHNGM